MITVILPCYIVNDELLKLTAATIGSLGECHLIVIDNGSSMGGGFLRNKADIYVRNTENLGYAQAVNQGLKLARTELVAISNNDIRVSPNWQAVAEEVFLNPDEYSCHFRMTDYDVPFQYGKKIQSVGMERWCTSSFFVVHTGRMPGRLFDEHFFNSYDDWDFHETTRSDGDTIPPSSLDPVPGEGKKATAYTDMACYQHHHSTTQQLIPTREKQDTKNREYFKKKWGEYPEDRFARLYPDQMKVDYAKGFDIG